MKKLRSLDRPPQPTLKCTAIQSWILLSGLLVSLAVAEQAATDQAKKLDSVRTIRKEKVATFKVAYPKVKVETNTVTGGPEDLWGDLSKNQTKAEPLEAAYEFFEQNKELYGITNPREELNLQYSLKDRYGAMVDFKQLYRGVEIYRSSIRAYFTPAGKLKGIKGGFLSIIDISTAPSVDSGTAMNLAKKDLGLSMDVKSGLMAILGERGKPSASLVVLPLKEKYYLAWVVKVWGGPDYSLWEYFIDAKSGEILRKEDTAMDYSRREKRDGAASR